MKKIAILTSVHAAFDIRIFCKEARSLAELYDVTLIAQHSKTEVVDGVRIIPLPKARNRFHRMFVLTLRTLWLALKLKADVYHFHDPELIPIGILLKVLTAKKVVADVHEDLPRQILSKYWIPRWLRGGVAKAAALAERAGVKYFDGVIAATPSIAQHLSFSSSKLIILQNFPIVNELHVQNSTPYQNRLPVLAYIGGITAIRGVKEMIAAVGLLPLDMNAELWLAGSFSPATLKGEMQQMNSSDRVNFLGWQSRQEIAAILGRARLGLILFHPEPNHITAQPNKLFEYMSASLPIVASDFPLWREIVEEHKCGLLVDPLDPKGIAEAICWLLENPEAAEAMGKRGLEAVYGRINWDVEKEKLLSFYRGMIC